MSKTSFFIPRLAVIGVGLIGGSLAQALKRVDAVGKVVGVGRSEENLRKGMELGVIDDYTHDPVAGVANADVVVLAVPVSSMQDLFERIKPAISSTTTITDVGSVKAGVIKAAEEILGEQSNQYVPGHPIAGTEQSGVGASFAELFDDHRVILTPTKKTDPERIEMIRSMWLACQADVLLMSVRKHDTILSITSHLPHVLAFALMELLASTDEPEECYRMAAGGFYDISRIASGDPPMWRDICLMNGDEIRLQITRYKDVLDSFIEMIDKQDAAALENAVREAGRIRAEVASYKGGTTSVPGSG